jgi:hypothetical protein
MCGKCAKHVGGGMDFCPPHARSGVEALVKVCAACLSSSCGMRDAGYTCARRDEAGTRMLTVAQWKSELSFGAIK